MSEYTPGPWRVGDREPYVEVWGPMRMNSHPILASMEFEPREANARLMAAAPDLLVELRNMVEVYWGEGDGHEPPPDCIQRANAVIAKAEGKPTRDPDVGFGPAFDRMEGKS